MRGAGKTAIALVTIGAFVALGYLLGQRRTFG